MFLSACLLRIGLDGFGLCQRLLRLLHLLLRHIELVAHSELLLKLLNGDGNLFSQGSENGLRLFKGGLL